MLDGRSWSFHGDIEATGAYSEAGVFSSRPGPNDFAAVWVNHPLMKYMARGVVWEARAEDGRRLTTFRVAEDGSFANVDDEPLELPPETSSVGVAHPLRWDKATRARWREIFADYELLQPFEQLTREPMILTEADLETATKPAPPADDHHDHGERLVRIGWERTPWGRFVLPLEDGSFALIRLEGNASGKSLKGSMSRDSRALPMAALDDVARTELGRGARDPRPRALSLTTGPLCQTRRERAKSSSGWDDST